MKIIVLRKGKYSIYIIGLLILVSFILINSISYTNILEVWSPKRELPIYSVDRSEKVVSITFDCAWGAEDIADILNTLKEEDIKSTFFIVGQWAEKFPDKVQLIAEDGHDIANHSYSHLRMGVLDNSKIRSEISVCGQKLRDISGRKVELFRPPYGDYNDSVIQTARDLGYFSIQWDVDSLDWKEGITPQEMLNRITQRVRNGSIILFHNDTTHTAKMLPSIIKALKKQGYGFLPVSKLILRDNYIIDYEGRQREKEY